MNNEQVRAVADGFAKRLAAHVTDGSGEKPRDYAGAIEDAYQIAYGRPPTDKDVQFATTFLRRQFAIYTESGRKDAEQAVLTDFVQMILGANEFVYIR
jgi:hypothetical protein